MTRRVSALNIEKLAERPAVARVLVYGESGSGKTTFASTAPRPILWLESEGGTHSIGDKTDIDVARVVDLGTYRDALTYLAENPGLYKTTVIDSFTETQAQILKEIMKHVVQQDASRDEFHPLYGEWGKLVGVMREIARAFRDLPMNLVITALEREDKDSMTGKVKVRPRLSPTLATELPGFMDVVGYLYAVKTKGGETEDGLDQTADEVEEARVQRLMLLQPTGKYAAKIRAPFGSPAPDFVRNPTFDTVAALLGISGAQQRSNLGKAQNTEGGHK